MLSEDKENVLDNFLISPKEKITICKGNFTSLRGPMSVQKTPVTKHLRLRSKCLFLFKMSPFVVWNQYCGYLNNYISVFIF